MRSFFEKLWYRRSLMAYLFLPMALIYQFVVFVRRFFLLGFRQKNLPVPVIIVGNISVGGVGKTPLVAAIVEELKTKGLAVGIISRGYRGKKNKIPYEVQSSDKAEDVGDEPLFLKQRLNVPVVIGVNRFAAAQYLLQKHAVDIIISDDGLQHYALARAMEIIVIDGMRGFGNGWCLPAGPLREGKKRMNKADFVVVNGQKWPGTYSMHLRAGNLQNLKTGKAVVLEKKDETYAAVAAIGNPRRFLKTLEEQGLNCRLYAFPDHHLFTGRELQLIEEKIIMTEKDAVKCRDFAADNWYVLPVDAELGSDFWQAFWSHQQIKGLQQ